MPEKVQKSLLKHRIRPTEVRERILTIFFASDFALSHGDIQDQLPKDHDRVTIYRTLNTFMEHGLIHKVVDSQGITHFALCQSGCEHLGMHDHDHLHFQCKQCGHTFCLPKVGLPRLQVPEGFQLDEVKIQAEGICQNCQEPLNS